MKSNYTSAVISAPRQVTFSNRQLDQLAPGDVRIRVEGCGVCGSNLPIWEGRPWFRYPLEGGQPGHEGWGVVDAIGADVTTVKPGTRVAALSYHAFAECDTCPADQVIALPSELAGEPFPGEALGCAMNVFRRCDVQPHHRVAVVGLGFLGLLLVQLAAKTGARVYGISRRAAARRLAVEFGAANSIPLEHDDAVVSELNRLTGAEGCDRVIEVTGFQGPLQLASKLTAIGGRLIIAGYHQDGTRTVDMQLWNWRGIDVINAHERDPKKYVEGMQAAANAVASGALDPRPLYSHRFPLSRLADALDQLRSPSDSLFKALVCHA